MNVLALLTEIHRFPYTKNIILLIIINREFRILSISLVYENIDSILCYALLIFAYSLHIGMISSVKIRAQLKIRQLIVRKFNWRRKKIKK